MAKIKISQLCPAGTELFQDSESFLNELNEQEMSAVLAGGYKGKSVFSVFTRSIGLTIIRTKTVVKPKKRRLPGLKVGIHFKL